MRPRKAGDAAENLSNWNTVNNIQNQADRLKVQMDAEKLKK